MLHGDALSPDWVWDDAEAADDAQTQGMISAIRLENMDLKRQIAESRAAEAERRARHAERKLARAQSQRN
jgi:hypothetical protein